MCVWCPQRVVVGGPLHASSLDSSRHTHPLNASSAMATVGCVSLARKTAADCPTRTKRMGGVFPHTFFSFSSPPPHTHHTRPHTMAGVGFLKGARTVSVTGGGGGGGRGGGVQGGVKKQQGGQQQRQGKGECCADVCV